jgi:V/A-type H+/Na+-transporting ATPase subunit I
MFRPVPMLQIRAVVLERHQRAVLKDWARLGAVQLVPQPVGLETAAMVPRENSAKLAQCERVLGGIGALRQTLGAAAVVQGRARPPDTLKELTLDEAEQQLHALEERAGELVQHREQLLRHFAELSALSEQVASYCGLELPLDEPESFEFLHFITGSLPAEKFEHLKVGDNVALLPLEGPVDESQKVGLAVPSEPWSTESAHPMRSFWHRRGALGTARPTTLPAGGRQHLVAITTHAGRRALEEALAQVGFEPERLPALAGATADTVSEENRREEASVTAELQQVEEQVRRLALEVAPTLTTLERALQLERRLLQAEQNVPHTEAAVLLSGWVPGTEASALEQRLREITGNRCVMESAAPEQVPEDQVPVLLHHARLLRPFELLVKGYGLPRYRELEPTLFVALSFVLMFGMMFGDVGQGAVLGVAGLAAWLLSRQAKARDVGLLLLFGGLSSMGFGALYGSYFGLPGLKRYALWHDPLEGEPMDLMRSAIGLGVAMLSLGLILNVVNRFRHGDFLGGFLDKFGVLGVLFYWGMLAFITQYAAVQSWGLVRQALLLCFVLPVVGWTLKGPLEYVRRRHTDGLWAAIAESLVEAFEGALSFLANTISFVRLAAYALSHAALLLATFMLAAQVQRASAVGSVAIIILGNGVAIVLEGVIAAVQALRLEYYEFFSKFFSGAGRAFEPFQLPTQAEAL